MLKGRAKRSALFLCMEETSDNFKTERLVRLKDADRSFDIEFWQRLGPEAIVKAAWELVEHAYAGKNVDLRLQRSVASFRRLRD